MRDPHSQTSRRDDQGMRVIQGVEARDLLGKEARVIQGHPFKVLQGQGPADHKEVRQARVLSDLWHGKKKKPSRKAFQGSNELFNTGLTRREGRKQKKIRGKGYPQVKEQISRVRPMKIWPKARLPQKRPQESLRRDQTKAISGGSSKSYFQEKSSRKLVFWDSDEVRPKLGTEKVNHRIVQPAVEGSDEQQETVKSEGDQWKIFRIQKKTSMSGKFTSDINAPKSISVKRKVAQKEASDQNVDFGLRMDFVDCKCKFGKLPDDFFHSVLHHLLDVLKHRVTEWNNGSVELNVQD